MEIKFVLRDINKLNKLIEIRALEKTLALEKGFRNNTKIDKIIYYKIKIRVEFIDRTDDVSFQEHDYCYLSLKELNYNKSEWNKYIIKLKTKVIEDKKVKSLKENRIKKAKRLENYNNLKLEFNDSK